MSTKPPDIGRLIPAECTLEDVHPLRMFLLPAVLVLSGNSLQLGQAIAALIANVLEMSFTSSLGLGCSPGNWGTSLFFSAWYKAPNQPAVQVSRNLCFFFFYSSSSFVVVLEALVKNNYVNPLQEVNVPHSALPGNALACSIQKCSPRLRALWGQPVGLGHLWHRSALGVARAARRQAEQCCAPLGGLGARHPWDQGTQGGNLLSGPMSLPSNNPFPHCPLTTNRHRIISLLRWMLTLVSLR